MNENKMQLQTFPDAYDVLHNLHPQDWINPVPQQTYDLVVIGAGPAGITAALEAATKGRKVALVEKSRLGGVSLNSGCVPSKTLIRASRGCFDIRQSWHYGLRGNLPLDTFVPDFAGVMERIRKMRAQVSREVAISDISAAGIAVFFGAAAFINENSLRVEGATLSFSHALIATGTHAQIPDIPGLSAAGFRTNETVFDLEHLPRRLLVIGGGPLGCEFAQAFQRLGSKVVIAEKTPLFLPQEERDAAQILSDSFARDGMHIRLNTEVIQVAGLENGAKKVLLLSHNMKEEIVVDEIIAGIGRVPNVGGLNLSAAKVDFDDEHGICVNNFMQTTNPRIYAAGDVCSPYRYSHAAQTMAHIATDNIMDGNQKKISAEIIPWCTYTDPEVAHVGIYVRDARAKDIPIKSYTVPMHDVDRAITDGEQVGFVKIHIRDGTSSILGATIVARHAGEMINEITLAMVAGLQLCDVAKVIHSYPTQAAAIKKAADAYARDMAVQAAQAGGHA